MSGRLQAPSHSNVHEHGQLCLLVPCLCRLQPESSSACWLRWQQLSPPCSSAGNWISSSFGLFLSFGFKVSFEHSTLCVACCLYCATDNSLSYLPEGLGGLTNLQSLRASNNTLLELPDSLVDLQALTSLDLRWGLWHGLLD